MLFVWKQRGVPDGTPSFCAARKRKVGHLFRCLERLPRRWQSKVSLYLKSTEGIGVTALSPLAGIKLAPCSSIASPD
jgi:hypothetical protein